MSITRADFVDAFPEFADASLTEMVESKLATAQRMIDESGAGDLYTDIVYLQAAHLLALSPMGERAKLRKMAQGTVSTVYQDALFDLKRQAYGGIDVI